MAVGNPWKHRTAGILCLANSGRESQARTGSYPKLRAHTGRDACAHCRAGAGSKSGRRTDNTLAACDGIRTRTCSSAPSSAQTRRRTLADARGNCPTATSTQDPGGSKSQTRTSTTTPDGYTSGSVTNVHACRTSARHRTTCRSHTTQSTRSNTEATTTTPTPTRTAIRCAQSAGLPARWCAAHLPQVS